MWPSSAAVSVRSSREVVEVGAEHLAARPSPCRRRSPPRTRRRARELLLELDRQVEERRGRASRRRRARARRTARSAAPPRARSAPSAARRPARALGQDAEAAAARGSRGRRGEPARSPAVRATKTWATANAGIERERRGVAAVADLLRPDLRGMSTSTPQPSPSPSTLPARWSIFWSARSRSRSARGRRRRPCGPRRRARRRPCPRRRGGRAAVGLRRDARAASLRCRTTSWRSIVPPGFRAFFERARDGYLRTRIIVRPASTATGSSDARDPQASRSAQSRCHDPPAQPNDRGPLPEGRHRQDDDGAHAHRRLRPGRARRARRSTSTPRATSPTTSTSTPTPSRRSARCSAGQRAAADAVHGHMIPANLRPRRGRAGAGRQDGPRADARSARCASRSASTT